MVRHVAAKTQARGGVDSRAMRNLMITLVAIAAGLGFLKYREKARFQAALERPSQFAEINQARGENKPLLFLAVPPGCPWAAHAAQTLPEVKAHFGDRYVIFQTGGMVQTQGNEPFDYLAHHCSKGMCLFNPGTGKVAELDEMLPSDQLIAKMEQFSGS